MLAFRNRFHGHGSLRYLYKNGKAFRSHLFTVKYIENARRKTPRMSVVVSKKVHKSAVGRNRMRRRMYEVLRVEIPHLKPDQDIAIIISSSEVRTIPIDEIRTTLQSIFQRSDLYK